MFRLLSRVARWAPALALPALVACADDAPSPTEPPSRDAAAFAAYDTILVTNTSGGTEVGSIRWALAQSAGNEYVLFDPSLAGATITLDSTLQVPHILTIRGPKDKGITLSGGDKVRVMNIYTGALLQNLTIANGYHPVAGGGIFSFGPLEIQNSTIRDNAAGNAGGIFAQQVTLMNSTVARNLSSGVASAISYDYSGGLALYNSTVTQNWPAVGIRAHGTLAPTIVYLKNSIIAGNGLPLSNCYSLTSVTYVGTNISDDATCGGPAVMHIADPKLGVLADRGGPGMTIDFAPQSPALNAGVQCNFPYDQRYVPRQGQCDVGAFEFTDFTTVTITIDPGASANPTSGTALVSGTIKCSRADAFGLRVELTQEQKTGRTPAVVRGSGGAAIACTTTAQPWRATVTPESGAFQNGSASAAAHTNDTAIWINPATATAPVKVARARK